MHQHDRIAYHRRRAEAERRAGAEATRSGARNAHRKLALQHEIASFCVRRNVYKMDRRVVGAALRTAFPA